jgi:hypothetical protein
LTVYFLDNDIIIKLSAYNLFWDVTRAWGIADSELRVLPTASSFIRGNPSVQTQYDQQALNRACRMADKSGLASVSPSSLEYQQLLDVMGIDQGEAVLIAATATEPDFYIVTADKRCLKALANSGMTGILNRLEHRIICLEQLLIRLIQQSSDMDKILRRINNAVECEVSVTEAFKHTDQAAIIQRLQAEVDRLRCDTGALLVP